MILNFYPNIKLDKIHKMDKMDNNDLMKLRFHAIEANNAYFYALCRRHGREKALLIFKSFSTETNRQLSFKDSMVKKDTRVYVNLRNYGYDFNKSDEERQDAIQQAVKDHGNDLVEKCCNKFGKYHSIVLEDWKTFSESMAEESKSEEQ
jgi:hypothetical protein